MTLINKLTKYTELLYNYLSEDAIYARRTNKCVTDMALGIITYYDDLLYKYHYNNYSEKPLNQKTSIKKKNVIAAIVYSLQILAIIHIRIT